MLNNNNKRQKVDDYHSNYKKFSNAQSSILYFSRTEIQDKVTSGRRGKKKQTETRKDTQASTEPAVFSFRCCVVNMRVFKLRFCLFSCPKYSMTF